MQLLKFPVYTTAMMYKLGAFHKLGLQQHVDGHGLTEATAFMASEGCMPYNKRNILKYIYMLIQLCEQFLLARDIAYFYVQFYTSFYC